MLETILLMITGAALFGGGATWGAWLSLQLKDNQSLIPFTPVEKSGVAYEQDDDGEDAEDVVYQGYQL